MNTRLTPSTPETNRRRSQRVMLSLPLIVSGKTGEGPFTEDTQTMVVNAHGALVGLKAKVVNGQTIQIKNVVSQEEQECRIIWVGPTTDGRAQCGIEFVKPSPKFWGISFPPTDW